MAGFTNNILNATNVNFSGANPTVGEVTQDGELLIGAAAAPHLRANKLIAGAGMTIINGPGTIELQSTGGVVVDLVGDSGSATGATINLISGLSTNNSGSSVSFDNSGNTSVLNLTNHITGNTCLGWAAGNGAMTGLNNTFVGREAGQFNTSGGLNVGVGYLCYGDTTGSQNTAMGYAAMRLTSASNFNVGLGYGAFQFAAGSEYNTAVGFLAMSNATGCTYNTAVGDNALLSTQSQQNTAIGHRCMINSVTGIYNTAVGCNAMVNDSSGIANTVVGRLALTNTTTGNYNTIVGDSAAYNYTSSESSNIVIGGGVLGVLGESNVLRIGTQGSGAGQQNQCWIGGISGSSVDGDRVVCASDGKLGTISSSSISNSALSVSMSDGVAADVTSISLTAGKWLVSGQIFYFSSGNSTACWSQITSTSATISGDAGVDFGVISFPSAIENPTVSAVPQFISVSSPTTYYLVGKINFSTGTCVVNAQMLAVRIA